MDFKQCWDFNSELNAFAVLVRIKNPQTQISIIKPFLFDTGFTGYLGLNESLIQNLNLECKSHGKALTATGDIEINNYLLQAELVSPTQTTLGIIQSRDTNSPDPTDKSIIPVQKLKIPLIGLQTILQFNWLIIAEKKWLCLIE